MRRKSSILLVVGMFLALLTACQGEVSPGVEPTPVRTLAVATAAQAPTHTPIAPTPTVEPDAPPAESDVPAATAPATAAPTATDAAPVETAAPSPSEPPAGAGPGAATQPSAPPVNSQAIIVDHNSVALFESIPDEYLERARNLRVLFVNQSVGQNISTGLDCLTAPSWGEAPTHCRRDYIDAAWNWKNFSGTEIASAPERIRFEPSPTRYDRSRWTFLRSPGTWDSSVDKFVNQIVPQQLDDYDVFSQKITYLMVADNSGIMDPENGFFSAGSDRHGWADLERLRAEHPDKIFFYWTSSLARAAGSQTAVDFNERMRQTAREQGLILFDIAAIESHTETGAPCFDNRDGVPYCSEAGKCEEHPDDGLDLPAICQDYTTEADGGHLGSVSGGKIRLAKAFWVLMAQVAGWRP